MLVCFSKYFWVFSTPLNSKRFDFFVSGAYSLAAVIPAKIMMQTTKIKEI